MAYILRLTRIYASMGRYKIKLALFDIAATLFIPGYDSTNKS